MTMSTATPAAAATITATTGGVSGSTIVTVSQTASSPPAARFSAGSAHTCGLTTGGAAYCWGSNGYGQLGDGTSGNRTSPVAVAGGLTFQALSAGQSHTCGLTAGGAAYCWGANSLGQLGDGTSSNRTSPVAVAGGVVFGTSAVTPPPVAGRPRRVR